MDERSIREIIREELKKLKGMTWGQRLGYIWDYYKPLMAAILAVILVISIGVSIYRNMQINHFLNVYFVNCNSTELDAQAITDDFAEYIGGIGAKDEILLDTSTILDAEDTSQYSMASQMKFTAVVAAGDVDVAIFDSEQYEKYRDGYGLEDLSKVLSEEQLSRWENALAYGKDEETGKEIPVALDVQKASLMEQSNAYNGEKVYAVVMANSSHTDMSAKFLEYLMQ